MRRQAAQKGSEHKEAVAKAHRKVPINATTAQIIRFPPAFSTGVLLPQPCVSTYARE